MGYATKGLMLELEAAKRRNEKIRATTLEHRIKVIQNACPHPANDRATQQVFVVQGEFRPGDTIVVCSRCSTMVHHSRGTSTGERQHLAGIPYAELGPVKY